MYQIKELAEFIKSKTKNLTPNDLIMLVGDFNISSRKMSSVMLQNFKDKLIKDSGFEIFCKENYDSLLEYKNMLKILSKEGNCKIIDFKDSISDSDGAPPTFGNVVQDEEGEEQAIDYALTGQDDLRSKQSLDYIFQILPNQNNSNSNEQEEAKIDIENLRHQTHNNIPNNAPNLFIGEDSINIENFEVKNREFSCLSDHQGISINVKINNTL